MGAELEQAGHRVGWGLQQVGVSFLLGNVSGSSLPGVVP